MLKYKMHILFIFILTLCTFTFVNAEEQKLKGKIIYLDAGHPSEIKPSINRTSCSK